jgi:hypothetical protein
LREYGTRVNVPPVPRRIFGRSAVAVGGFMHTTRFRRVRSGLSVGDRPRQRV